MAADEQSNSDPWPYLMIDRAVEPAVSLLSTRLGVTPQHARGGLVGFWGNCADPRDLEKLHTEGKNEVVFTGDEVSLRFALAMAVDRSKVDPEELAAMRLLERRPDGSYRVRGMSRYFKPLAKRMQFRTAAVAGGRTRSTAARGPDGRFLPVTGAGPSAGPSAGSSAGSSAGPSAGGDAPNIQPTVQPPTTTEDRGQRSSVEDVRAQAPGEQVKRARPPRKPSAQQGFHSWAQAEAGKLHPSREPEKPPEPTVINSQLRDPLEQLGRKGLELAWVQYLKDAGAAAQGYPWGWFVSQLPRHYNAAVAVASLSGGAPKAPKVQVIR